MQTGNTNVPKTPVRYLLQTPVFWPAVNSDFWISLACCRAVLFPGLCSFGVELVQLERVRWEQTEEHRSVMYPPVIPPFLPVFTCHILYILRLLTVVFGSRSDATCLCWVSRFFPVATLVQQQNLRLHSRFFFFILCYSVKRLSNESRSNKRDGRAYVPCSDDPLMLSDHSQSAIKSMMWRKLKPQREKKIWVQDVNSNF